MKVSQNLTVERTNRRRPPNHVTNTYQPPLQRCWSEWPRGRGLYTEPRGHERYPSELRGHKLRGHYAEPSPASASEMKRRAEWRHQTRLAFITAVVTMFRPWYATVLGRLAELMVARKIRTELVFNGHSHIINAKTITTITQNIRKLMTNSLAKPISQIFNTYT